jgi:integration host factor subunit beta
LEVNAIQQSHEPVVFTWAQIYEAIAGAIDVSRRDAEAIMDAIFSGILDALNRGDKVELRGFGTFTSRKRGARVGRNPKTGVRVDVPPKRVPHFKPSKELLQIVNR